VFAGIYKPNVPVGPLAGLSSPASVCLISLYIDILHTLPYGWLGLPHCTTDGMRGLLRGGGNSLLQAAAQLQAIYTATPPILVPTTNRIIERALRARAGIDHVIMVPHSQGNLFTIQAFQALANANQSPTDSDAACFAALPTASPTSSGYPIGTTRISAVQVAGDVILSVPGPKFPPTPTYLSTLLGLTNLSTPLGAPGVAVLSALRTVGSIYLHKFVESYLAPSGARELVKKAAKDIYSNCEITLAINGPVAPVSVGSVSQLALTITGADGRNIADNVVTTWASTDTAVATVSAAGSVTAVAGGEVLITATHRGKIAEFLMYVDGGSPDPNFTVSVVDTVGRVPDPFTSNGITWRQHLITVRVTSTDTLAAANWLTFEAFNATGDYFHSFAADNPVSDGTGGLIRHAQYFDCPQKNGIDLRFGDRYWCIDRAYVRVSAPGVGTHWLRIPLSQ
jgi:hypothetical protein